MHIQPLDILRINLFTILVQFGPISAKTSTGWGKSAEVNLHSFRSLSETWWALKSSTGWGKSAAVCTVFEVWNTWWVDWGCPTKISTEQICTAFEVTWWVDRGVQTTNLRLHTVQCTAGMLQSAFLGLDPNSRFTGGDERGIWASRLFGFLENL